MISSSDTESPNGFSWFLGVRWGCVRHLAFCFFVLGFIFD